MEKFLIMALNRFFKEKFYVGYLNVTVITMNNILVAVALQAV